VKKSRLDSLPIKDMVIQCLAVCETQKSIAKDVGLNQSQISRFARREDIKPLIEQEQQELISTNLPMAGERLSSLLQGGPKDYQSMKLQLQAASMIHHLAWILASPEQWNCTSCKRLWKTLMKL
jgi:hypothetical protein